MRITLVSVVALTLLDGCVDVRGQSTFQLANYFGSGANVLVNAPVYDWSGGLLSGSDWRVELYGGAVADSLTPVVDVSSGSREIISFYRPGYFRSANGYLSVLDVPAHGWAWLQVRVWDVALGGTYEEAVARGLGGYGASAPFYG